ncbi:sporulation related protein [Chitinophaga skermanii]|uniref:Sporulation related protein n=1 Tax=Chitinophaga skermanii TaxID=331697 RepID=A0A327R3F5_9BACT|nr:SPOR domain-containing protein [Chitinophaga skermanii]RAJ10745.1 sporulation related protein [Chitinophaga skermanii]
MQKLFCLPVLMLLFATAANAQVSDGSVKVVKDSRIDILVKKQVYINTLAIRNQPGFRVQVINTTKRNDANEAKARVMQAFPDVKTYLEYQSPYFKVRVGDFKTRDEATELRDKLSNMFPGGVFVIPTIINLSLDKELMNEESN